MIGIQFGTTMILVVQLTKIKKPKIKAPSFEGALFMPLTTFIYLHLH